tara:strand:- start:565 stop:1437 length:873 start_codon:yes stop_codon:yes gene_type:complete
MDKIVAQAKAREFLSSRNVNAFPVDAEALAGSLGFQISYKDLPDDESGFSISLKGKKHLCVNRNHDAKRQRFTIFHEIAHEWLQLPSNHNTDPSVPALGTYIKRPIEEIACDIFAAECLLPWKLFKPFVEEEEFILQAIDYLSDEFQASRLSVASRFADQSPGLHAYVLSEGGAIVYVAQSKALRDLKYWIPIGIPLPKHSASHQMIQKNASEGSDGYSAMVWSSSDVAGKLLCNEECFALPKWRQAASLLTFDRVDKNEAIGEQDVDYDSELLPELTGELAWKKRVRRR